MKIKLSMALGALLISCCIYSSAAKAEFVNIADYYVLTLGSEWHYQYYNVDYPHSPDDPDTGSVRTHLLKETIDDRTITIFDNEEPYYLKEIFIGEEGLVTYSYSFAGVTIELLPLNAEIGFNYHSGAQIGDFSYVEVEYLTYIVGFRSIWSPSDVLFKDTLKVYTIEAVYEEDLADGDIIITYDILTVEWFYEGLGIVRTERYGYNAEENDYSVFLYSEDITHGKSYYESGMLRAELLETANVDGFVYFVHLDENFNSTGIGRISRRQKADASYELLEYFEGTDNLRMATGYDADDNLLYINEYNQGPSGDVTGDRKVDLADLNNVRNFFGSNDSRGDADGDGVVGLSDLNAVRNNFGTDLSGAPATVISPELTSYFSAKSEKAALNVDKASYPLVSGIKSLQQQ